MCVCVSEAYGSVLVVLRDFVRFLSRLAALVGKSWDGSVVTSTVFDYGDDYLAPTKIKT